MSIADYYPDRNGDSASGLTDEPSCPSFSVVDAEDLKQTLDRGADRHVGEKAGRSHARPEPTVGGDGAEALSPARAAKSGSARISLAR
jgi:hypothetical protein